MRFIVVGASGLVGRGLCRSLLVGGHTVAALTRDTPRSRRMIPPGAEIVPWDPDREGPWRQAVMAADAVVNLAGESIAARRWSGSVKRSLRSSRLTATRAIVDALLEAGRPDAVLLSASASGFYAPSLHGAASETSPAGSGFLAQLCADWEHEAMRAEEAGIRVVLLRLATVLSAEGGALPRMALPFRLFVGGPLGSGRQSMSWIHADDAARMIEWAALAPSVAGPMNVCAPRPVSMREFAMQLGIALGRPALLPVPGFVLRALMGEMAETVLTSCRLAPEVAERGGFDWRHPGLPEALHAIFG